MGDDIFFFSFVRLFIRSFVVCEIEKSYIKMYNIVQLER